MPEAKLKLTIPDNVWIGELTRNHPDTTFRILGAISDEDTGISLVKLQSPDPVEVFADFESRPEVVTLEVLRRSEGEAVFQFETTNPKLLLPAQSSQVPLEMPFEVENGTVIWTVTASTNRLSELQAQLRGFGIPFTVEYVKQDFGEDDLLTDKQRRIVKYAIESGYYDTPRQCSLTDLAEDFDIAKSTASDMLHRAEGKIINWFAEQAESELVCNKPDPDCDISCSDCPLSDTEELTL